MEKLLILIPLPIAYLLNSCPKTVGSGRQSSSIRAVANLTKSREKLWEFSVKPVKKIGKGESVSTQRDEQSHPWFIQKTKTLPPHESKAILNNLKETLPHGAAYPLIPGMRKTRWGGKQRQRGSSYLRCNSTVDWHHDLYNEETNKWLLLNPRGAQLGKHTRSPSNLEDE